MRGRRSSRPQSAAPGSGASPSAFGFRIALYYLGMAIIAFLGVRYFPALENLILMADVSPAAGGAGDEITRTMAGGAPVQGAIPTGWDSVWVTGASVLGALVIMIPVAWTYILIKRDEGYEEAVVHTLLILPVAVAGIVTIVQGSLALAFSLAGIVAAVRFRTTLDDTKDAVYVFLAIGVGLAAGVQALGVALALSVVFNAVNLILWRLNFGDVYADRLHRTGGLGLGTVIAGPKSSRSAVVFGSDGPGRELAPQSLDQVRARQAKIRAELQRESPEKRERRRYSALLIYTPDPSAVQRTIEQVLEAYCDRAKLADVIESEEAGGVQGLTWLVRLNPDRTGTALVAAVRDADESGAVVGAEFRSLQELAAEV